MRTQILAACLATLAVFAEAPEAWAHRPFASEDAGVVPPGRFELELGHDFAEAGAGNRSFSGSYTLNAGVFNHTEVDISTSAIYYLEEDGRIDRGFGDVELLLKHRLADEAGQWPALAVAGNIAFPTGNSDRGLGRLKTDYKVLLAATKTSGLVTLHANTGWSFLSTSDDLFLVDAALAYRVSPRWHLLAEWDGATDFESGTENERWGLLLGALLIASEKLVWDAGVRFGFASEDDNVTLTSGLTVSF